MATKLHNLTSFWQNFGLAQVQKDLDEVATEITSRQDASDASKKALIELLREFKKSSSDEAKQSCQPVVKSFQNEVDALAKRAKAAEKAFFDIYKTMADIPDPLPILEQSVERNQQLSSKCQDAEIEINSIRETMSDQAKEIADLKSKEKKMLELQALVAQYDKNIDETMKEKLAGEIERVKADFEDRLLRIEEEKDQLTKKCKEAEMTSVSTHHLLEQAQSDLYEANLKLHQKSDAKSDEIEMVLNDLEAANQRAITAEKECDNLREIIKTSNDDQQSQIIAKSSVSVDDQSIVPQLKNEITKLENEISNVKHEIVVASKQAQHWEQENGATFNKWNENKLELTQKITELQTELDQMSDYAMVKKDLKILKSLEFNTDDSNEDVKPLEVMILERSKSLQAENTSLRMEKERLAKELIIVQAQFDEKSNEADRNAQLATELEDHVERLQEHVNRGEAEGRSSADILYDLDLTKGGRESPMTSISSSFTDKAHDLLPIIQAQRERYRKRNEELEDQQTKQFQQLSLLQTEVKDLQADNVKLYEKIRYLQGYQQGSTRNSSSSIAIPVESKYKNQYEQRLDPFTTFSNQERQRKYSQLNIIEKLILSMVHFMLSNKVARLFTFAYAVLLHGLVFVVLMWTAYSDANRRDHAATEWQQKYLDHMMEAHQENHH
eukprot:13941.XXX_490950_493020_1 [CDS] Oithona nana genome sequencing.